nr:hypothetical protein [Methanohalobium evestigatum]
MIPALINCRKTNTSTDILYNLIYTIDSSIDHPRNGVSKSQHYETLINLLKIRRTSLIVIFDEIDYLEDEGIIYNLSREDFEDIDDKLFISMVGITNDYSFFGKIGPGVKSSFGNESLEFPGYDSQELVNILNERSSIAFKDGCLDEGTIPYCAALTASDKKDARYSLEILKTTGDIADFENSDIITQDHVLDAYKKLNQNKKIQATKSLSLKQGFVLFVILKSYINNKKPYSGNIINMYKKYGKKLDMSIPSNNRISEYITELDKIGLITANDRGGRGNSRVLEPTEDPYVLFDAIKEANPIFEDLYL